MLEIIKNAKTLGEIEEIFDFLDIEKNPFPIGGSADLATSIVKKFFNCLSEAQLNTLCHRMDHDGAEDLLCTEKQYKLTKYQISVLVKKISGFLVYDVQACCNVLTEEQEEYLETLEDEYNS